MAEHALARYVTDAPAEKGNVGPRKNMKKAPSQQDVLTQTVWKLIGWDYWAALTFSGVAFVVALLCGIRDWRIYGLGAAFGLGLLWMLLFLHSILSFRRAVGLNQVLEFHKAVIWRKSINSKKMRDVFGLQFRPGAS